MKLCKYCNQLRKESEFEIAKTTPTKIYRRLKCQKCKQQTQKERRKRTRNWFTEYKKTLSCSFCGIKDHRCIDFHHLLGDKEYNIATLGTHSKDTIMKEVGKCIPLCSNCHRILHYRE